MSWQMLDGPSRRPRLSWAFPEHLRDNSRYGPFRRLAVPAPLDPDALMQYMDNAISITENAQATKHLSLLFASSSSASSSLSPSSSSSTSSLTSSSLSLLPSSSSSSAVSALASSSLSSSSSLLVGHVGDDGASMLPLMPSTRKFSRFKSVPLQQTTYVSSSPKDKDDEDTTKLNDLAVSQIRNTQLSDERVSIKIDASSSRLLPRSEGEESVSEMDQNSDSGEEPDAQAADDAYKAACCALSEGDAERALSLLHVASAKCPPNKQNALGKVHRLMADAMQLVEKNSTVLRSLPVDKDAK